ncbi:MAG: HPr(Ser) kinase/phosphatase [Clostridia bacterium]|nr:HPr(Ser) kinase/phosphatase [Clostridia bacterium]
MSERYFIKLSELIEKLDLSEISLSEDQRDRKIYRKEVNRPGLFLAGFHENFDPNRIQILGKTEYDYLESLSEDERNESIRALMEQRPICLILCQGKEARKATKEFAMAYDVPLLMSRKDTSYFMSALISVLNVALADRITRHGVLVEVYGEGVLLLGDSGVGKSETAIDLVKRGHRLIADDAVEIKKVSDITLVGSAPETIRHYVELRGIGVVDIRRLFGMGAVKDTEKIELIIHLEQWEQGKFYERLGMDMEYTELMGIKIPSVTIPVRPGRNLALIIEIATMNTRQRLMGFNTAQELEERLMKQFGGEK